ncbi:hypothetical protein CPC08DRAFT_629909, partial [Agrocybe pediades]
QTTAEQDMEIIRIKRATTTASAANNATGGSAATGATAGTGTQQKNKYRKRSRATPPGKCHSCNIRETPEWRRGPDGARTLCNACGLHYAKLVRKKDKSAANGETVHIDMETLRASARAAEVADKSSRKQRAHQASETASSPGLEVKPQPPPPPAHQYQTTFQLSSMMSAPAPSQQQDQNMGTPSSSSSSSMSVKGQGQGQGDNGIGRGGQQQQQQGGSSSSSSQQQQQQQQHGSSMGPPPPSTTGGPPQPPWMTTTTTTPVIPSSRPIYPAPDHLQHQSFLRGSQR